MASSRSNGDPLPHNFYLTPQQQNLLFTALNANKPQSQPTKTGLSLSPSSFRSTPLQSVDNTGFQESPFADSYDYDFGDSSLDFSFAGEPGQFMIGDLPGETAGSTKSDSTENESSEKRSHPDDEDDDASPGNESKRHESGDKVPKKPGRKPLTSEPTSKRKAQNRAAQRAFRERKEKHLKDLETKVEELEKASEAANHENSMLRAQVERITSELNHYKSQMVLMANKPEPRKDQQQFANINDVNFRFEFPKFGTLPGPRMSKPQAPAPKPVSPPSTHAPSTDGGNLAREQSNPASSNASRFNEGLAKFSNAPQHHSVASSATGGHSRASVDSANHSLNGYISSPATSSHSNMGPSSSCGTSPEAFTLSPVAAKPTDALTTIGEENAPHSVAEQPFGHFANMNFANNDLGWFVQQNGGHFDPQLFGDYREPQDNILTNPSFDDLFNDLEADFFTPYNTAPPNPPAAPKKNLIEQIDAQQSAINDDVNINREPLNCNSIWDKLQNCPRAQSGDFDLDGLCSELTKKAKCSGNGPVVAERDFDTILKKYMGKDVPADKFADRIGIKVEKQRARP